MTTGTREQNERNEQIPSGVDTGGVQLYQSSDGLVQLKVRTDSDTVWLTRQQMATLFGRDVKTIGKHVANAQREELAGMPTVAKFATVQHEGDRLVERHVEHYNLDMILSVGYRVKSSEGVRFRQWANEVLRRYLIEGAAINEQRLQQLGQVVRIHSHSNPPYCGEIRNKTQSISRSRGLNPAAHKDEINTHIQPTK